MFYERNILIYIVY